MKMLPLTFVLNISNDESKLILYDVDNSSIWNVSLKSNNTTASSELKEHIVHLDGLSWALVVLYTITFLVGLSGNALVCFAVWRNKNMRTVTNIFLVNLAAADLGVIIICLPPALLADVTSMWYLGSVFCKIHLFLSVSTCKVDKKGNDQEPIQSNYTSCPKHQMNVILFSFVYIVRIQSSKSNYKGS